MQIFYRRNLPHFVFDNSTYFITSRLTGSLPINIIRQLQTRYENDIKSLNSYKDIKMKKLKGQEIKESYFTNFDEDLYKLSNGPYWLSNDKIAKIVSDALHFKDKKVFDLIAYTIMPNHIHIIIKPTKDDLIKSNERIYDSNNIPKYPLGDIMKSFKGFTSRNCNKILNRSGPFWHHENYDHIIRDYNELIDKINYVLENPVKAGLVNSWEKWKWNYYNQDLL